MKVSPESYSKMQQRHKDYLDNVEELTSKNYIPRGTILEELPIPKNSASLIVIPSNVNGSGFLRNGYDDFY